MFWVFWWLILGPNLWWFPVISKSVDAVARGRAVKWGRNIRFRNIVRFRSDKALMVIGTGLITSEFQQMLRLTKEWCLARGPRPWLVRAPTVKVLGWSDNCRGGANSCDYSSFVGQSSGDEMNHCFCDVVIDDIVTIKWYEYVTCEK